MKLLGPTNYYYYYYIPSLNIEDRSQSINKKLKKLRKLITV